MIYKFIDQVLKTKDLLDLFYKLMDPVWNDIEIKPKTYIHCYLDSVKKSLRTYYNGIRGFDDPKDLDYFEEKYTKTWKYPTGTLHYFWVGEENARTGDPEDYQNVYKFIPKNFLCLFHSLTVRNPSMCFVSGKWSIYSSIVHRCIIQSYIDVRLPIIHRCMIGQSYIEKRMDAISRLFHVYYDDSGYSINLA